MKKRTRKPQAEVKTQKQRPWLYVCLSFAIPFFVIVVGVIGLRIMPFGDKHNLAISDGRYYLNTVAFLQRLLKGQENILYSLKNGLGGNEWSILAWGGFNPVLLLCLFAKLETLPSWFTWVSIVNLAVCGLTMYILLAGVYGHKSSHLIFSTSYALIGFSVVNCYQTLFFIGPQTLPLVILGLVWLCRGKSPLLYILSLAFCIFFNFYFGFMLCVASVVFFLAKLYTDNALAGKRGRLFGKWAASSVVAGLLAAPIWLPALKAYSGGGRLNQTTLEQYTFTEQAPFIQIFSKLFSGANSLNETVFGLPNIFCGILTVVLVILFFMNRQIPKRKKIASGVVLGFYLLTFYLPAFSNIMHGFTVTNWFPYRYSFVFSFWLLYIAAEQFEYIDVTTFGDLKRCGVALLVATILVFSTKYEFISGGAVVLDLALLGLMALGFWLYKTKPEHTPRRVLVMFLLLVVCGNLYANYVLSIKAMQEWELDLDKYQDNLLTNGALVDALNKLEPDFFRMEKEISDSSSVGADPYLYNYNGISHSGPAERWFIHRGLGRLGINRFDMRHWYSEGIPAATDALMGLKYVIAKSDLTEIKGYEQLVTLSDKSIYQSDSFLSPAILANGNTYDLTLGDDVFDNLNDVWKGMTGGTADIFTHQPDVTYHMHSDFTEQTVTSAELAESAALTASNAEKDEDGEAEAEPTTYIEYTLTAPADGPLYYFDTSIPDSDSGLTEPAIHLCGVYKAGETVTGKIPLQANIGSGDLLRGYCVNLAFATENLDVLADYARQLNTRDCSFNVIQDNHLTGEFTAEANQRILFTLPWDEGWTCTIDGQKVPIDKTWDLFMSVEAPEGKHTYEMRFTPAWLNYGLYLSAAALVGLVVLLIMHYRKRPRGKKSGPSKIERPVTKSAIMPEESKQVRNLAINFSRLEFSNKADTVIMRRVLVFSVIIGFIIWMIGLILNVNGLQRRAFFFDANDWFMDYFNTVYYSVGKTPYTWGFIPARNYLPIAYMLLYPFSLLYPYDMSDWTTAYASRYSQVPAIACLLYIIFSVLLLFILLKRIIQGRERERYAILLAFLVSSVMLFNYDRANLIIFTAGLVLVYYILLDSKSKIMRQIGLLCLAMAAVLKIFPAFFGVLLLQRRRWKDILYVAIYTLVLALLPFFWLEGGFVFNIQAFIAALHAHVQMYAQGTLGFNAPMILIKDGIPVPSIASYILAIVAVLCAAFQEKEWKNILQITLAFLLCSNQQGQYCMIFLFLPIVLFLNDQEHSVWDWIYLLCFILILIPTQFEYLEGIINNINATNTFCVAIFLYLTFSATYSAIMNIKNHPRKKNSNRNI